MMLPLTPDVQARMILCSKENQRNELRQPTPQTAAQSQDFLPQAKTYKGTDTLTQDINDDIQLMRLGKIKKNRVEPPSTLRTLQKTHQPINHNSAMKRSKSSCSLPSTVTETHHANVTEKAVIHRSKSMITMSQARSPQQNIEDEERRKELETMSAARAALPSRMHCMRHIFGFRTYNKLPEMRKRIIEACELIESMASSQHGAYQLALSQVDESLDGLAIAEQNFYRETDRVRCSEEKVDELDYLKANIELCIKESVTFMRNKYYTEYLPLVGNHKTDEEERRWRDHNEIRIFVNQLKTNLKNAQEEDEENRNMPSITTIHKEIQEARAQCAQPRPWRSLQPLIKAEDQLIALRKQLDKIQRLETLLKTSLLRYQASTNTLINVNREVKATTRILRAKAELAAGTADSETRDLEEEDRLLREFVIAARHADSGPAPSIAPTFSPSSSPRDYLSPTSLSTPATPLTSPHVWLTTWSPRTKVLPDYNEHNVV